MLTIEIKKLYEIFESLEPDSLAWDSDVSDFINIVKVKINLQKEMEASKN